MTILVRIENAYSDGHESTHHVELQAPTDELRQNIDKWFEDVVFEHTGDGHGAGTDLGSCYVATICATSKTEDLPLLGKSYEWVD